MRVEKTFDRASDVPTLLSPLGGPSATGPSPSTDDAPALEPSHAPALRALAVRSAQVEREKTTQEQRLQAWRRNHGGFDSMARLVVAVAAPPLELLRGHRPAFVDFKTRLSEAELFSEAPQRKQIRRLDHKLEALREAANAISEGRSLDRVDSSADYVLEELLAASSSEPPPPERLIAQRLQALQACRTAGDRSRAQDLYLGAISLYTALPGPDGDSVSLVGGRPSFTEFVNQLVTAGVLSSGQGLIYTSEQLARAERRLRKQWYTVARLVPEAGLEFPLPSLRREVRRLRALERGPVHRPLLEQTGLAEAGQILRRIHPPRAMRGLLKKAAFGLGRIFDSPETWAMMAVGALTHGRLSGRLLGTRARGGQALAWAILNHKVTLSLVGGFAAAAAIDGAAFHAGMNLFNLVRRKGERADWGAMAFARSGLITALTGLSGARHFARETEHAAKAADAGRQVGLGWRALEQGRYLAEEMTVLSSLAIGETYARTRDLSQAGELVLGNLQFLVAMRMLRGAQQMVRKTGAFQQLQTKLARRRFEKAVRDLLEAMEQIEHGTAENAERVDLQGTIEALTPARRAQVDRALSQYSEGLIALAFGDSPRLRLSDAGSRVVAEKLSLFIDPSRPLEQRATAFVELSRALWNENALFSFQAKRVNREARLELDAALANAFEKASGKAHREQLRQVALHIQGLGAAGLTVVQLLRGMGHRFKKPAQEVKYYADAITDSDLIAITKTVAQTLGNARGAITEHSLLTSAWVDQRVERLKQRLESVPGTHFDPKRFLGALLDALPKLQADLPGLPPGVAAKLLRKSLAGESLEKFFEKYRLKRVEDPSFDAQKKGLDTADNAGTIAQGYALEGISNGTETGQEFWLKLYFPDAIDKIERSAQVTQLGLEVASLFTQKGDHRFKLFNRQFKTSTLLQTLGSTLSAGMREYKRETHPKAEAANAVLFGEAVRDDPRIAAIRVYDYGKSHLVMDHVVGEPLDVFAKRFAAAEIARRFERLRPKVKIDTQAAAKERLASASELHYGLSEPKLVSLVDEGSHYRAKLEFAGSKTQPRGELLISKSDGRSTAVGAAPDLSTGGLKRLVIGLNNSTLAVALLHNLLHGDQTYQNVLIAPDAVHLIPLDYGNIVSVRKGELTAPFKFLAGFALRDSATMAEAFVQVSDRRFASSSQVDALRDRLEAQFRGVLNQKEGLKAAALAGLMLVGEHGFSGNYFQILRAVLIQSFSTYSAKTEYFNAPPGNLVTGWSENRPDLVSSALIQLSDKAAMMQPGERQQKQRELYRAFEALELTQEERYNLGSIVRRLNRILEAHGLEALSEDVQQDMAKWYETQDELNHSGQLKKLYGKSSIVGEDHLIASRWVRTEAAWTTALSNVLPTKLLSRRLKQPYVDRLFDEVRRPDGRPPSGATGPEPLNDRIRRARAREGHPVAEPAGRLPVGADLIPPLPLYQKALPRISVEPEIRAIPALIAGMGMLSLRPSLIDKSALASAPWFVAAAAVSGATASWAQGSLRELWSLLKRETPAEAAIGRALRQGAWSLAFGAAGGIAACLAGAGVGKLTKNSAWQTMAMFAACTAVFASTELAHRSRNEEALRAEREGSSP